MTVAPAPTLTPTPAPAMESPAEEIAPDQLHRALAAAPQPAGANEASGTVAAVTLVTPNRRLAVYHKQLFDQAQQRAGRRAWATPDILPLATFTERAYRGLTATDAAAPAVLDPAQSLLLWEQIVRRDEFAVESRLMNLAQTARQAAAAWALAQAWHLLPAMRKFALHEDAELFLAWTRLYDARCREQHLIDAAVVPDRLAELVGTLDRDRAGAMLPQRLLAIGFDIVTPQQRQLLRALDGAGVDTRWLQLAPRAAAPAGAEPDSAARLEFADEAGELAAAAAWVRERLLAEPGTQVAIVVPGLETRRAAVVRALTDALYPGARAGWQADGETADQTTGEDRAPLFNVSLGLPLADYPLVRDALGLIELSQQRPLPFAQASSLLLSPFIAGADAELMQRAQFDARLRETAPLEISLVALYRTLAADHRYAPSCARLLAVLAAVLELNGAESARVNVRAAARTTERAAAASAIASPQHWSRHFWQTLQAWGFPGDTPLDSAQFQVLAKLRDAVSSLARLQTLQPTLRADEALAQLRRGVADTLFQPEADPRAPVQVLGVLESAGQRFDGLWVLGLSDDAWPLPVRPNPFIPAALQRAAGVPDASADVSLALDARLTAGWRQSARALVLSHARGVRGGGEQQRAASVLCRGVPLVALDQVLREPIAQDYARALFALATPQTREPIPDIPPAPLPAGTAIRGGAGMLSDQAACPFRAFARHRLGARALAVPHAGLDPSERGTLLHRVLSLVWGKIGDYARLMALSPAETEAIVATAVTRAITETPQRHDAPFGLADGRFGAIEHARLVRLVGEWLIYEQERGPFRVVERETLREAELGGLRLQLRLDRLDRLADGTHALIDYKTGVAKMNGWLGERPDEPQLPLYYLTAAEEVSALAFARVKRGERRKVFGFEGVSVVAGALPDVAPIETKAYWKKRGYDSWDVLTQQWETALKGLTGEFIAGRAEVAPKYGGATCARCDLHGVCRVAERAGALARDGMAGEVSDRAGENDD